MQRLSNFRRIPRIPAGIPGAMIRKSAESEDSKHKNVAKFFPVVSKIYVLNDFLGWYVTGVVFRLTYSLSGNGIGRGRDSRVIIRAGKNKRTAMTVLFQMIDPAFSRPC